MTRQWAPYWQWEDFQAGMYAVPEQSEIDRLATEAVAVLSSPAEFLGWAAQVVKAWPIAAAHNLTAVGTNRRAWVGQAACCFGRGVPEIATRAAWKQLDQRTKDTANAVADEVIRGYEAGCSRVRQDMEEQGLFGRHTGRSAAQVNDSREGTELQGDCQGDPSE